MASQGDPRVLLVMNLVLSLGFCTFVVWGLALVGPTTFSWRLVAMATGALMLFNWLVVLR